MSEETNPTNDIDEVNQSNPTSDIDEVNQSKKGKGNALKIVIAIVAVILVAAIVTLVVNKDKVTTYFTKDKVAEVYSKPVSINSYKTLFIVYALKYESDTGSKVWKQDASGKSMVESCETASINYLIQNKVMAIKAEKEGIKLTAKEKSGVTKNAKTTLKNFKQYQKDSFKEALKKVNLKESDFDVEFKNFFFDSQLTMDLQSSLLKDYKTPLVRAEHILITVKDATNMPTGKHTDAEAKKIATEVLAKVKAGENFETLAKKYSEDTSASTGGDLGYFEKSSMVPEFGKVAYDLKAGQVSGLVKTQFGYHIIKVLDHNTANKLKLTSTQKSQIVSQAGFQKFMQKQYLKWKKEANVKEIKANKNIVKESGKTKNVKATATPSGK